MSVQDTGCDGCELESLLKSAVEVIHCYRRELNLPDLQDQEIMEEIRMEG